MRDEEHQEQLPEWIRVMIYIMNLIMAKAHLLTCLITTLMIDIILLIYVTTIIIIMLSKRVGQIWERFKVTRQIQEAKMTIWKWIKLSYKCNKPHGSNTRSKTSNKKSI